MNKGVIIFGLILIWSNNLICGQHADTIVFKNVNVVPMDQEVILPNQRVVISGNKILSIKPESNEIAISRNKIIDGTNKYLIPGLSEMHYHYRNNDRPIEKDFALLIANGITTARNLGEYEGQDHILIREQVRSGKILGPNYYTTGPYLQSDRLQTTEDVIAAVKQHKERGYDYLKIGDGDNIEKHIYLKLLEEAYQHGVAVIGHAQHNLPLEYSLRMKSIEHVEEFVYLFQDSLSYSYLENDQEFLIKAADQVKTSGIYVAPTLVVFEMITQYLNDEKFALLKSRDHAKYLPAKDSAEWLTEENHYRKDFKDRELDGASVASLFNSYFDWMKNFTKILSDHKVPLMSGSDTFGMTIVGFSLHDELGFLCESGLTPYEALVTSTVTPARYLNTISVEGTVSEGKKANLVLLKKNPLEDISHTKTIEGVMLNGRWFGRTQLDALLKDVELFD